MPSYEIYIRTARFLWSLVGMLNILNTFTDSIKTILGTYASNLDKFEVDSRDFLKLLNLIPAKWTEFKKFFKLIFDYLPQHKYAIDDKEKPLYRVMSVFSFPNNGAELCYGLHKKWMPFPSIYILFPVLRYVP